MTLLGLTSQEASTKPKFKQTFLLLEKLAYSMVDALTSTGKIVDGFVPLK